jgi:hypothetical protein
MDLQEVGWVHRLVMQAQDRYSFLNAVINLLVPKNAGYFLSS